MFAEKVPNELLLWANSLELAEQSGEQGNREFVVAGDRKALARAVFRGTADDVC